VKAASFVVVAVLMVGMTGCASAPGASRFTGVSLTQDLDAASLARYRAEAEQARSAGQSGSMLVLERTNHWPLGLLAYWRQGSVKAMGGADGPGLYTVTVSRGYGPLSIFFVSGSTATFSGTGQFLHGMDTRSVLWGHVAMQHVMNPGGGHVHKSLGLLHHLINIASEHGRSSVSLFSAPNPVTFGD
jgi:hypothetical protein